MKRSLFAYLFIFANVSILPAQITADSVQPGTSVSNPFVNLTVAANFQNVADSFDIDCDGVADMKIEMIKGETALDNPNYAVLKVKNSLFEICADPGTFFGRQNLHYYNKGDTLKCTHWATDTIYNLGNYGCMLCSGPLSVNNLYIAYRKTGGTPQVGWIKISFNLSDQGNSSTVITLSVNEVLSQCLCSQSITINGSTTITAGSTTMLTAIGANTYSWFPPTGLCGPTANPMCCSPSATTTYTVTGTSGGCTMSTIIIVTVNNPTSVEKLLVTNINMLLFPNPNNGTMQINYDLQKNSKGIFTIYDILGKKEVEYELQSETKTLYIDEPLKSGIYFYKIIVDDKIIATDKIVIIQ